MESGIFLYFVFCVIYVSLIYNSMYLKHIYCRLYWENNILEYVIYFKEYIWKYILFLLELQG